MKKILVIGRSQFGYHSDTYYMCKYLKDDWKITYLSWDYRQKRIYMDGVEAIYISRNGSYPRRKSRFLKIVLNEIKNNNFDIHFVKYIRGCSLLKILNPSKNFIFDIRSGAVYQYRTARLLSDCFLRLEAMFFKHKTVISRSLAEKLNLNAYILPLGADVLSESKKTFSSLELLYVGTLFNRNIGLTIEGFSKFYHNYKDKLKIRYTIVGTGPGNEEERLKKTVKRERLKDAVVISGLIPHNQIKPYFDSHNIGVSFIPITAYFDVQPPTKTFEYLLSGMPVIATNTTENKKVINPENGVLINDDPDSFCESLKEIYRKRNNFCSEKIREDSLNNTWSKIFSDFKQHLENISDRQG